MFGFKLILLKQSNKEQLLDNGKSISNRKASKCKTVRNSTVATSVADPDPNPDLDLPDPHVFGPPGSGSGSISLRYGSRSGSFYLQNSKKNLDFYCFVTSFDFLSVKHDVPSKSNMQKNFF